MKITVDMMMGSRYVKSGNHSRGRVVRAKDLERELLINLRDSTPGELDQRVRALRTAGHLPVGGRGPHAPHISPRDATWILLSLTAPRPKDSLHVAEKVFNLELVRTPNVKTFHDYIKLGEIITALLSEHIHINFIRHLRINTRGNFAWIESWNLDNLSQQGDEFVFANAGFAANAQPEVVPYIGQAWIDYQFVLTFIMLRHVKSMIKPEAENEDGLNLKEKEG